MGFLDDALETIDEAVDSTTKALAKGVQKGGHLAGDLLDDMGLHSAGKTVSGWGDDAADSAGLRVAERSLDESDDPSELLHGDAKRLNEVASHLKKFHDAFDKAGQGLKRLDTDHWTGQAGDNFRKAFDPQPKQWLAAADACGKAGSALAAYAHTVGWAHEQAKEAVRLWKEAKKKAEAAMNAYVHQVNAYNAEAKAWNATPPDQRKGAAPVDPGKFTPPADVVAQFKAAEDKLSAARTQRNSAARTALATIKVLVEYAPPLPSSTEMAKAGVLDAASGGPEALFHFGGGILKSAVDLEKLLRGVNPLDPYNITHPAEYATGLSGLVSGLEIAVNNPGEAVKSIAGSGWGSDPAEAGGKLFGNLLLAAGTGGGGTATTLAEREVTAVAESAAEKAAADAAKEAAEKAAMEAGKEAAKEAAAKAAWEKELAGLPPELRKLRELEGQSVAEWPKDPLKSAASKDVDLSDMQYAPKWRTTNEDLYRFDNRSPEEIFTPDGGFHPRANDYNNIYGYASANRGSVFVGTTRDPVNAIGTGKPWRYDIDAGGGIDVNATLRQHSPFSEELEVVFPGGVNLENIKGAWQMQEGKPVQYVENPYYRPEVGRNSGGHAP
ncbi:putative T7SS-secreted protein [Kitasatospora sp. NPDC051170]|uniref:putative T7SS-secreted protein n=1 Tax=Kitasatospora sp. NPDC051170 TaxID=3364056 RepID=UPI00379B8633